MARREQPESSSTSAAPLFIGVTVLGVALGLGLWALSHDSQELEAVVIPRAASRPGDDGAATTATPTAPALLAPGPLFASAAAGTLTLDTLLDHVHGAAGTLDDTAETFPLRDGGLRLTKTLADGTDIKLTLSSSRRATEQGAVLDTISVALTPPLSSSSLPAPWSDVPGARTLRLSMERSPTTALAPSTTLSGFAEAVITPSSSPALIEELLALSPPGRARTGTRFEWSAADTLRQRAIYAAVTPETSLSSHNVDANTRPAIPRPERLRALADALFTRAEARLATK